METFQSAVKFDSNLLQKYDYQVPRYTSYPTATELRKNFGDLDYKAGIAIGNYKQTPISLYCHIPFCQTGCYFCGCNTIITQSKNVVENYLKYLEKEIKLVATLIDSSREVNQLHLGGGTPNYLSLNQISWLKDILNQQFSISSDAEISLEINPRYVDKNYIFKLKNLGFNRISFGVQDFNPKVQDAINRIQPESSLFNVMDWIREAGFESVNVDLIYGLPFQTLQTFQDTIQKTIMLNPDRIAVFNFAYVPWIKPIQKKIPSQYLPQPLEKLDIFQMTIEELTNNGYVFIGMDHFSKPDDELAIAQRQGKLHRNFQGYTTKPESDLFAFGITSISMLHDVYTQNHKFLKEYYKAIDSGILPIEKGISLNRDDVLRRAIIMDLMCQFKLSISDLEDKYHIAFDTDFEAYFAPELLALQPLVVDGLIKRFPNGIEVTSTGRLLVRNIASVFDAYSQKKFVKTFSRAV